MTCSTCRHHTGPQAASDGRRECRANAPTLGLESQQYGPKPVFLAAWPLTLATDGCGQHSTRNSGLGTEDSGLGTEDSGLGTEDSGLGTEDSGLGTEDSGLGTEDSGLEDQALSTLASPESPVLSPSATSPVLSPSPTSPVLSPSEKVRKNTRKADA
jgi:hypothetical protein